MTPLIVLEAVSLLSSPFVTLSTVAMLKSEIHTPPSWIVTCLLLLRMLLLFTFIAIDF